MNTSERRRWLQWAAAGAAAGLTPWPPSAAAPAGAAPVPASACTLRPRQTEGPYFVEDRLNRRDIRGEPQAAPRPGVPLTLRLAVARADGSACRPVAGAVVDLWQCDAAGVYSGVRDLGGGGDTRSQRFLRGHQVSGADGEVEFLTIFPGWYPGRAVHLHVKIRHEGRDFTSQLYVDDALCDEIHALAPYRDRGHRDTPNHRDGLYRRGGSELLVPLQRQGSGASTALSGRFTFGLQAG